MGASPISLAELNGLSLLDFTRVLLNLYNSAASWVPVLAFAQRPFLNLDHLHRALAEIIASSDPVTKEQLIQFHPDTLGLLLEPGMADAAPDGWKLEDGERKELQKQRAEYFKKFGFPLVVFLDPEGIGRPNLIASVAARLENSREQEITNGLDEIVKEARGRLSELITE